MRKEKSYEEKMDEFFKRHEPWDFNSPLDMAEVFHREYEEGIVRIAVFVGETEVLSEYSLN